MRRERRGSVVETEAGAWEAGDGDRGPLRRSRRPFRVPVPDRLLKAHDFFDLYPLDGGGALSFYSLAGPPDDAAITRRVLDGGLLRDWGTFPQLDFAALERWRTVEKSCWLNRFYIVASMARTYALTRDERIARGVRDLVLHFIRRYPPPQGREAIGEHIRFVRRIRDEGYNRRTFEENQVDETDVRYIWFDFQPASRILHLVYALHFLRGSPSLSPEDVGEIERSLYRHAETVCIGEKAFMPLRPGNHQSLRGLSLLYAGAYFEGIGTWREFLREGARICRFHVRSDFQPDGSLRENSPSYHCFETWHMRDAVALARDHGFALCPEAGRRLEQATAYLRALRQPDGHSPTVNDGYPVRLSVFEKTLPRAVARAPACGTTRFKDAGMAFFRDRDRYLALDASPFPGPFSHYHAGKGAVIAWWGGRPFLVDSGCPNYEDPWFAAWYKTAEAHSSLLVGGVGDGLVSGLYHWVHWADVRMGTWRRTREGMAIEAALQSSAEGWSGVAWRRRMLARVDGSVVLSDTVSARTPVDAELVLNFHPDVRVTRRKDGAELRNGTVRVRLEADPGVVCEPAKGRCFEGWRHRATRQIRMRFHCEGTAVRVTRLVPLPANGN